MIHKDRIMEYGLAYFWLLPGLICFGSGMASRILGGTGGSIVTMGLYSLLVFVVLHGYNKGILRATGFDAFFVLFAAFSILSTYAFFPKNQIYLNKALQNWPFAVLFYIVGKSIVSIDNKHIHTASAIGICLMFYGYFAFKGQTNKDMSFAYSTLPYVIGITHGFFWGKKLIYKFFTIIGLLLLFLLGTRGPLVISIGYFVYCFLMCKHSLPRIILCLTGGIMLLSFIESDSYMKFLEQLNDILRSYGINSYILQNAIIESTASVDSRISRISYIIEFLKEDIISIHGLCGDRVAFGGPYAHNVFAEILYSYGGLCGIALLLFTFVWVFSLYTQLATRDAKDLLIMVIFAFVCKLLFSGSFVSEIWLYFVVGIISRLNYKKYG